MNRLITALIPLFALFIPLAAQATTVTFTTPGSYTWVVPSGITSLNVTVTGGGGGAGKLAAGGPGGIVTNPNWPVLPGQTVPIVVGGGGDGANAGYGAGGGGGASSLNVESAWVIAGGGGGGAGAVTPAGGGYGGGGAGCGFNGADGLFDPIGRGGTGGVNGIGGIGGAGAGTGSAAGANGGNGYGGAGGWGPNGSAWYSAPGSGVGNGTGGNGGTYFLFLFGRMDGGGGGGGGGYGGGGGGGSGQGTFSIGGGFGCDGGGGGGGYTGGTCTPATNGGSYSANGSSGSVSIMYMRNQSPLAVTGPLSMTFGAADTVITTSGGSGTGAMTLDAGSSSACSIVSGKLRVISGTGSCSITATKAADNDYYQTTSAPFTVSIAKANQPTLAVTGPGSMTFGDTDTTITTSGGSGTGVMTLDAGSSGACSIVSGKLHVISGTGSCSITATKAADNNYNLAISVPFGVTILKSTTTMVLTSGTNPSTYGDSISFLATVNAVTGTPTDSVTFYDGATPICSALPLDINRQANCTITPSGGAHIISAIYAGGADFTASSGTVIQKVIYGFSTVSAGYYHNCGVKSDGTVGCWGMNTSGSTILPGGTFLQVSAGRDHTCGVKSDGSAACRGNNLYGQAPDIPAGQFVQVSAGYYYTCGVKDDGTIACWGNNDFGQAPATLAGPFVQVAAGSIHTCGLKSDGSVACWGDNAYDRAPASVAGPFVQVTAGVDHTCGVKVDGTVACWGSNGYGQAPATLAGPFVQVTGGRYHSCGLKSDNSVVCWGNNDWGQAPPSLAGAFVQVDAGALHNCGVKSDGTVACWGLNEYGRVPGAVAISPASLPDGATGTAYNQTLTASGGSGGPYSFGITAGTLPAGLGLAADGALSGTPTTAGSYSFTVRAFDITGLLGVSQDVSVTIVPTTVNLAVTLAGSGTVAGSNGSGADYNCTSSACPPMTFTTGDSVSLTATPDAHNSFTSWNIDNGAIVSNITPYTGLLMNGNRAVVATFTTDPATVKIDSDATLYYTIDSALAAATSAAPQPRELRAQKDALTVFSENIIMTNPISILLKGGYDASLTSQGASDYTTISGSLKIKGGKLLVDKLRIKSP